MLCLLGWRPSVAQGVTPVGYQVRTALYTIIRKSKVKWPKGSKKRHNGALSHTALVRWIAGEAICTLEGEHEREPVILPGGAEGEPPVPKVVAEQADLDKDEGQVSGVQELVPGIAEDEQQGQAHRQKDEGEDHLP